MQTPSSKIFKVVGDCRQPATWVCERSRHGPSVMQPVGIVDAWQLSLGKGSSLTTLGKCRSRTMRVQMRSAAGSRRSSEGQPGS